METKSNKPLASKRPRNLPSWLSENDTHSLAKEENSQESNAVFKESKLEAKLIDCTPNSPSNIDINGDTDEQIIDSGNEIKIIDKEDDTNDDADEQILDSGNKIKIIDKEEVTECNSQLKHNCAFTNEFTSTSTSDIITLTNTYENRNLDVSNIDTTCTENDRQSLNLVSTTQADINHASVNDERNQETSTKPSSSIQIRQNRTKCRYGSQCYRLNSQHKLNFCHPGDLDYENDNNESDSNDEKPECTYGMSCYRKNKSHRTQFKHTKSISQGGSQSQNSSSVLSGKKRKRKSLYNSLRLNSDSEESCSILSDDSLDDYQPTDDSSDSDDTSMDDDGNEEE